MMNEPNDYKLIWDALTPEMQAELREINDPAEPVRDVAEILLRRNMAYMDDDNLYEIRLTQYGRLIFEAGNPSAPVPPPADAELAGLRAEVARLAGELATAKDENDKLLGEIETARSELVDLVDFAEGSSKATMPRVVRTIMSISNRLFHATPEGKHPELDNDD